MFCISLAYFTFPVIHFYRFFSPKYQALIDLTFLKTELSFTSDGLRNTGLGDH